MNCTKNGVNKIEKFQGLYDVYRRDVDSGDLCYRLRPGTLTRLE